MPWYENRNGERLWYEESGTGCTVLLLHGWCMSSAVWKYQFDSLSDSLRIIAPDLRGHGHSSANSTDLTFSGFANDLIDLFVELNLSQVLLVGWSMGAQIAMQASAELSNRLAGLLLVSATPRFTASYNFSHAVTDNEARGMRLKVKRDTAKALKGFYSQLFAEGELETNSLATEIRSLLLSITPPDTTVALNSLDALSKTDMREILPAISTPTLILNGALDRICLPQASYFLAKHIPNAEHTVFPTVGHAPFLSNPLKFNAELLRFSRSVCEQHKSNQ